MEHNHMIEALAPNGTDHPLYVGSLPRGSRRGQHFLDAHVSHLSSKLIAEDSVAVAQQVARELVEGKCLPQLLSCPLCGRAGGLWPHGIKRSAAGALKRILGDSD